MNLCLCYQIAKETFILGLRNYRFAGYGIRLHMQNLYWVVRLPRCGTFIEHCPRRHDSYAGHCFELWFSLDFINRYNEQRKMSSLEEVFISQASAKQRQGRAGRVRDGICFRMFTKYKYSQLRSYSQPEIQRVPLEGLCLHILVRVDMDILN